MSNIEKDAFDRLEAELKEARSEIQKLKDRPSMSCRACEEHNIKLAEELDSVKRWEAAEERKSLAFNAWLEASGVNDFDPGNPTEVKEFMEGTSEKSKEAQKKFNAWWEHNKFFQ